MDWINRSRRQNLPHRTGVLPEDALREESRRDDGPRERPRRGGETDTFRYRGRGFARGNWENISTGIDHQSDERGPKRAGTLGMPGGASTAGQNVGDSTEHEHE